MQMKGRATMSKKTLEIRISEDFRLPVEVMERIQDELKFCTGVLEVISHDWRVRESYEWHTLYLAVKSEYGSIHNFIVMDWDYIGLSNVLKI